MQNPEITTDEDGGGRRNRNRRLVSSSSEAIGGNLIGQSGQTNLQQAKLRRRHCREGLRLKVEAAAEAEIISNPKTIQKIAKTKAKKLLKPVPEEMRNMNKKKIDIN
ncbi:hypothetical protein M0R45_013790 [Rubus argutus]|uniref:Uncharacterized protein n=1 Tax=Rubus argutus TaxID=59490 RepID=A0AAW1XL08_RUBAR